MELLPDVPSSNALGLSRLENRSGRHFGPVLDRRMAPDTLRFSVVRSGGVRKVGRNWVVGKFTGIEVGMWWGPLWEEHGTFGVGTVTLDLRELKRQAEEQGRVEVDLDPTLVNDDASWGEVGTTGGATWPLTRTTIGTTATRSNFQVEAQHTFIGFDLWFCGRLATRWVLPNLQAAKATLTCTRVTGGGGDGGIDNVHVSDAGGGFTNPAKTAANYQVCKTAYDGTPIGRLVTDGGGVGSLDVTSAWNANRESEEMHLGMVHYGRDFINVEPSPSTTHFVRMVSPGGGANEPVITFVEVASGSRLRARARLLV